LILGLGVALLGLIAYVVQISSQRLSTPWYMPIAATLGVLLVILSLWNARTIWRLLGLLLVLLVAGAEWTFLLGTHVPAYTGPVVTGKPFPAFATTRADGSAFTQHDLEGDRTNVLVFFRGRW